MHTDIDFRLPRTVTPRHYDIRMEPDLEQLCFKGFEIVKLDVHQDINMIVLNSLDLNIHSAELVHPDSGRHIAVDISYDPGAEQATLGMKETAFAGVWELRAEFSGELNDHLHGFYRSTYIDEEGREKVLATTQFESTHARRAFPCWDEPDLKATFGVTLVVDEGLTAISNQPEKFRRVLDDGRIEVIFEETMIMSTYLLAFIVGDLEATDPIDVSGVPLRIIHTPGKANLTAFPIEVAIHGLKYFSDYYGIPYPGEKLDMIAIPDFAWGAMENLGAITYRESDLLIDLDQATHAEIERVAAVISHELAHMWFGDLVTMRWWNGIWLNEAFATFMEIKCIDRFRPEWESWLYFGSGRNAAMEIDALGSTRPIEIPVAAPAEAEAMFDVLTYEKGSAVLRMLEQYLGENVFREGIRSYLSEHAYSNTVTDDLWNALERASEIPVSDIMKSWIYQGGLPALHVSSVSDGYLLEQDQFQYIGDASGTWKIPVLYRTSEGGGGVLLESKTQLNGGEDLVLNAGGHGYYRVCYNDELLQKAIGSIDGLMPSERYALVKDVWAGVLSGQTTVREFFDLAISLRYDSNPVVWNALLPAVNEIRHVASLKDRYAFASFILDLVSPAVEQLGWHASISESDLVRKWRGDMLRAIGVMGGATEMITEARGILRRAVSEVEEIDADVQSAALTIVAANGSMEDFAGLIKDFYIAENPQTKNRYRRAMTAVPEAEAASITLDMVLDGAIRRQDAAGTVALLLGHRDTGAGTWTRLKDNWGRLIDALGPSSTRRILDFVYFRSEPDIAIDIKDWLQDHPLSTSGRHVTQQLERLDVRVSLRTRVEAELESTLASLD